MKEPKTLDEMIEHLKINKNMNFEDENSAREKLLIYNYHNVITPFKHRYTTGKKDFHIYDDKTSFESFYADFTSEVNLQNILIVKLLNYERKVNAIFSYHFVHLVKEYGFNNIIMDSKNRLENTLNEDNTNKKYKIFDSKLEVTRKQIRYYINKLDELERLYTNGEKVPYSLFLII